MIIGALSSFLGGAAFRMIWGEASAWWTKRQDHRREVELMRLQGELDGAQHARNLEAIRVQYQLGVQVIRVQAEAAAGQIELSAWERVVDATTKLTGIGWVDAWNASIRPGLATIATGVWLLTMQAKGWVPDEADLSLVFAILGIYIADRTLGKRGK